MIETKYYLDGKIIRESLSESLREFIPWDLISIGSKDYAIMSIGISTYGTGFKQKIEVKEVVRTI